MKAPDFQSMTYDGKSITLSELYQRGPVVLVFYRGGWCPYCNRQLKEIQDRLKEFKALNAKVIAISVDQQEYAAEMVKDLKLGFDIISDPDALLLKSYHLEYPLSDNLVKSYKEKHGIDIEGSSGRKHHIIAVPGTFVIDRTGTIVYAYVNKDYKIRPPVDDALKALFAATR